MAHHLPTEAAASAQPTKADFEAAREELKGCHVLPGPQHDLSKTLFALGSITDLIFDPDASMTKAKGATRSEMRSGLSRAEEMRIRLVVLSSMGQDELVTIAREIGAFNHRTVQELQADAKEPDEVVGFKQAAAAVVDPAADVTDDLFDGKKINVLMPGRSEAEQLAVIRKLAKMSRRSCVVATAEADVAILQQAHCSVAFLSAPPAVTEKAAFILANNDLASLVDAIAIARRYTRRAVLKAYISHGRGLRAADLFTQKSDPYVILRLLKADGTQLASYETPYVSDTLDPVWSEANSFSVTLPPGTHSLHFDVMDSDLISDDFLGCSRVVLDHVRRAPVEYVADADLCQHHFKLMERDEKGCPVVVNDALVGPTMGLLTVALLALPYDLEHCSMDSVDMAWMQIVEACKRSAKAANEDAAAAAAAAK